MGTTPDTVGGLPKRTPSVVDVMDGLKREYPVDWENLDFYITSLENKIAELCRAAPAGGDLERGKIDPSWSLFDRVDFALRDAGFDLDEASKIAALASGGAPAGSGEVGELIDRLCIEADSWDSWNADHPGEECITTPILLVEAAALLRKLQQGAE